jgi:choline monooxygenase
VFTNNPNHIRLFRAVPIAVDRTRFETWELQYPDGDETYREAVDRHWERLKKVVQEDVEIFQEWAAARMSSAHPYNILNDHECKIAFFHRTVQDMLDA